MSDWIVIENVKGSYQIRAGKLVVPAIIGRGGFIKANDKREGDEATPCGRWPLRRVFFREDRVKCPITNLSCHSLTRQCGWCDDVNSDKYNRYVRRPFSFRNERMWRKDVAYDFVVELGYNDDPIVIGNGSAIFLHCIPNGKNYTAGCVAVDREDLANILPLATIDQHLLIPDDLLTS